MRKTGSKSRSTSLTTSKTLNKIFDEISDKFKLIDKKQLTHDEELRTHGEEIEKANERIIQAKEINNQAIKDSSFHVDTQVRNIVDDIIGLKKMTSDHDREIKQHTTNFQLNSSQITLIFSQIEKLLVDVESLRINKVEKEAHVEDVKSIWDSIRKAEFKINEHYNHLLTIENFVEKYATIRTQSQISEVLHTCLDKKYK